MNFTKEGEKVAQIYVKYNPYKLETMIKVNGKEIEKDSGLFKVVKEKRLQEWVGQFPQMLIDELNTINFSIEFYGMALDWDDFEDVFQNAKEKGIIKGLELKFIEGSSDEDINQKIVDIFTDLQNGPIEDFRDTRLLKAFDTINHSVFPVNVIATMSSGKSTLINALLCTKIMPSKNEACTATIMEILDNDKELFTAVAYDEKGEELQDIQELTYKIMNELNDDEKVHKIAVRGNIPFLDAHTTALMLVDTPGPNNSQNEAHKKTTFRAINNDSNNLILYVLNGTQLRTNDDEALLKYVADQIKKGGKQVRDRFLFVINKMDGFNPEEEDIGKVVQSAQKYLAEHGISDPQIFPCSAYTALNIRTHLKEVDVDNLTRAEEKKLPSAARDTLPMIDKFNDFDSMHLEQYSTLSPSAQNDLNYRLRQAEEEKNIKEQVLIHCGIYSIEEAITAYVKKYAKTKKVKDLVESFREVLESNQILVEVKAQVAEDEEAAKACMEKSAIVKEKIKNGEDAKIFKERIAALNPMDRIEERAKELSDKAMIRSTRIFYDVEYTIRERGEAERIINQFTRDSSDAIAELISELESVINHEVKEAGERILDEYQEKLLKIDQTVINEKLDFNTADLIKGALAGMREKAEEWGTDFFATETIETIGEVTYETKVFYEKVGSKEEEVLVGTHEELIGTRKVITGSRREKVGTREVRNQEKRWWKIFTPRFVQEDIYEIVDEYEDEEVYKTVKDYEKVIRDVYRKKTEEIEKFSVKIADIQMIVGGKLHQNLDEGIKIALYYAEEQICKMKQQFTDMFEKLDALIVQKYEELEVCARDQKQKEEKLKKNKDILVWLEAKVDEINKILEI